MSDDVELLKRVYGRFNARDIETLLVAIHEDVIWAKIVSVAQSDELVKPNTGTKEELLRAASGELGTCRVHAQNEYDTKWAS